MIFCSIGHVCITIRLLHCHNIFTFVLYFLTITPCLLWIIMPRNPNAPLPTLQDVNHMSISLSSRTEFASRKWRKHNSHREQRESRSKSCASVCYTFPGVINCVGNCLWTIVFGQNTVTYCVGKKFKKMEKIDSSFTNTQFIYYNIVFAYVSTNKKHNVETIFNVSFYWLPLSQINHVGFKKKNGTEENV